MSFCALFPQPPLSPGELFPAHKNEKEALDLVMRMLQIHPKKRITIDKAIEHPFLESLHNAEDEPLSGQVFSFELENEELSRERVQELIWEEIREYHPEIAENYPSAAPRRKPKQALSSSLSTATGAAAEPGSKAEQKDAGDSSECDDGKESKATKKRSITPVGSKS